MNTILNHMQSSEYAEAVKDLANRICKTSKQLSQDECYPLAANILAAHIAKKTKGQGT